MEGCLCELSVSFIRDEMLISDFLSKLKPFEARIVPRSEDHAKLVSQGSQD